MSGPLADEWSNYEAQVAPFLKGDLHEIQGAFLAGAASTLASLHEALMKRPSQFHEVFLEYSSEIRDLLKLRPRKRK